MERTVTLAELGLAVAEAGAREVSGLAVDSRAVRPGNLFAALPGVATHGAAHAAEAVARGAAAILTDKEGAARIRAQGGAVPLIVVDDPRATLARAAALWFGAQPQTLVAVTGTNGKTSVATFTRQIWTALGHRAINIGTTGVEGAWTAPVSHTTPEPLSLHRILADAAAAEVTHAAMEASSHGLDQRRLDGASLQAAAFTNFTRDHLDYHASFSDYFRAKAGLFERVLPPERPAVLCIDDPAATELETIASRRGQPVIRVGRGPEADLRLGAQRFDATGQDIRFQWRGPGGQLTGLARLELIGGFQAINALTAVALAIATGTAPEDALRALGALVTVRGRMQLAARRDNGAAVFVDYAHTPDAVATALQALRPHVMGRLLAIVGAGGDRDRAKRPLMGRAAAENADLVLVTDDNPRSEDPAAIRADVLRGAPEAQEVADRAEAILRAVAELGPGDALLICGKGHEQGQIIGDRILPFDDVEQASMAVAALDRGAA